MRENPVKAIPAAVSQANDVKTTSTTALSRPAVMPSLQKHPVQDIFMLQRDQQPEPFRLSTNMTTTVPDTGNKKSWSVIQQKKQIIQTPKRIIQLIRKSDLKTGKKYHFTTKDGEAKTGTFVSATNNGYYTFRLGDRTIETIRGLSTVQEVSPSAKTKAEKKKVERKRSLPEKKGTKRTWEKDEDVSNDQKKEEEIRNQPEKKRKQTIEENSTTTTRTQQQDEEDVSQPTKKLRSSGSKKDEEKEEPLVRTRRTPRKKNKEVIVDEQDEEKEEPSVRTLHAPRKKNKEVIIDEQDEEKEEPSVRTLRIPRKKNKEVVTDEEETGVKEKKSSQPPGSLVEEFLPKMLEKYGNVFSKKELIEIIEEGESIYGKKYNPLIELGFGVLQHEDDTIYLASEKSGKKLSDKNEKALRVDLKNGFPEFAKPLLEKEKDKLKKPSAMEKALQDKKMDTLGKAAQNEFHDEVQKYIAIANAIIAEANNVIIIHCNNGRTRTPIIAAAYLVRKHGLSVDEALKLVTDAITKGRPALPNLMGGQDRSDRKLINVLDVAAKTLLSQQLQEKKEAQEK